MTQSLLDHVPKPEGHRWTDRSRTTTDWECRRARWYGYEFQGRGLVADGMALELFIGSVLHDAVAAIAIRTQNGVDINIDEIATTAATAVADALKQNDGEMSLQAKEQSCLVEALIRGFHRAVWPGLIGRYPKVVGVEEEMPAELTPWLTFMTRPDLILQDEEGNLHYPELKSTSWKKESWINQWTTAIQLHSTLKAIEANLGQMPLDVTILGMYKGYTDDWGKFNSPLVYAYRRNGNPPFTKEDISYKWERGYFRCPVWELEGGVKQWVERMPASLLSEQFPQTPPIFPNEDMMQTFFRQLVQREAEIRLALQVYGAAEKAGDAEGMRSVLDVGFPQNFSACRAKKNPCPFLKLCHGSVDDPIKAGFQWRTPNHPQEVVEEK